jgi:asparagine synthetase B (glutamine-hydrolysing)
MRERDLKWAEESRTTRARDFRSERKNRENRILIYWSVDFALDFLEMQLIAFWMMMTLIWMMLMLMQKKLINERRVENRYYQRHILVWFVLTRHRQHNERSDRWLNKVISDWYNDHRKSSRVSFQNEFYLQWQRARLYSLQKTWIFINHWQQSRHIYHHHTT